MAEFNGEDLSGSRFYEVDLTKAHFENVEMSSARFQNVYLTGSILRGLWLEDVDIDGEIRNVTINGVDIGPLIEAELDKRHPERTRLHPTDADGFREAWAIVEQAWQPTIERARRLPPEALHERVEGEWSFIETLRHLLSATDAWVGRALLGDPSPYSALGLMHTEAKDIPGVPNDPDLRPSLDEVLELRAERMAMVRQVMADLTDEKLAGMTEPVMEPGYPESESFAVQRCLQAVVNEEWAHRLFAERDLAVLEARQ
jgi:uncharacterized damage-inducible protein DinB